MMLPRLSGGVTRLGPAGRARGGIWPSPSVCYSHCNYTCNDGTTGCADGSSSNGCTAAGTDAENNAKAFCNNGHNGYQGGTTGNGDCVGAS